MHVNWRTGKTSNWPSSTWQGDVAKKKNQKPRGLLRDSQAEEEKKRWRRSGRRQFYFPLCWFKRVEKSSEDLGTQQTKADPPLLGLKVLCLSDTDNIKMIIKDSKGMIDRPLLRNTTGKNDSFKFIIEMGPSFVTRKGDTQQSYGVCSSLWDELMMKSSNLGQKWRLKKMW